MSQCGEDISPNSAQLQTSEQGNCGTHSPLSNRRAVAAPKMKPPMWAR